MKLNNLKLRTRIFALVVILLLTTAGLNSFNILSIQKVARDGKNVYHKNFVGLRDISAAKATAYATAATIYEHLSTASTEEVSATTEEQMASVEQIATSAEGLAQQAKVLQQIVLRFKLV